MEPMNDATDSEAGQVTVASYATYAEAQRAVDALSDAGFPVESVSIVGHDVRLVERVTGRLTTARAAGAGALSGAWVRLVHRTSGRAVHHRPGVGRSGARRTADRGVLGRRVRLRRTLDDPRSA
jgi:uncharacterized protein YpuA (DUF1002 family)